MGEAMATRLGSAGNEVRVWNRTRSKTDRLVSKGATVVDTIADLGEADIVFIMVARPNDLEAVLTGPEGLLAAEKLPSIIVDCSTVSESASAAARKAANERGVGFLASPISGNPHVVAEGEACFVVSGPKDVYDTARPYLETVAKKAVYVGSAEESRLVKLSHNLYLGMMAQALVECVVLAEKGGIDRADFLEFLNGTVVTSDWVRKRTKDLVDKDATPTFTTELLRKDFDLGLGRARDLEAPMPVGSLVHQLIQAAIGAGLRDKDFLSLYVQQSQFAGENGTADDD
jgi:3-hydroxyisobutyrate dehydrogenase-like beta-hydroxyacid dehydrogenase